VAVVNIIKVGSWSQLWCIHATNLSSDWLWVFVTWIRSRPLSGNFTMTCQARKCFQSSTPDREWRNVCANCTGISTGSKVDDRSDGDSLRVSGRSQERAMRPPHYMWGGPGVGLTARVPSHEGHERATEMRAEINRMSPRAGEYLTNIIPASYSLAFLYNLLLLYMHLYIYLYMYV
jgi:hypothetical protein